MWLRDFFRLDLETYRTMIYGYNTKWYSKSLSDLKDMGQEFLDELKKARRSEEVCQATLIYLYMPLPEARHILRSDQDDCVGNQSAPDLIGTQSRCYRHCLS